MKSRSHHLPPLDPPDDWIDGSWTVDCSCGVTFDDGEEMVSCDECGVWVHTRCSRFVKGESSFACHNCKKKQSSSTPVVADTEETEVAQLLVELPTKTDPCPAPSNPFSGIRLWAEAPLEDRVHAQGVPGGDDEFFKGITSSVFTKQLWKCSGYVPKKFNFQYREFSCWDEKDGGENENENTLSQGADVLFSLSKEAVNSCVPVRAFERKKEGEKVLLQGWGRKERNRLRVFSSKRRKEELGEGKDRSLKRKKARSCTDKVADAFKKRGSLLASDMKKVRVSEDAGSDARVEKSEERKEDGISCHNTNDKSEGMDCDSKPKHVFVIKALKGGAADEAPRKKTALEVRVKVEMDDEAVIISSEDVSAASLKEQFGIAGESVKKEDVSKTVFDLKQPKGESNFQVDINEGSCPVVLESKNTRNGTENLNVPNILSSPGTGNLPVSNGAISLSSKLHKHDAEPDRDEARDAESTRLLPSPVTGGNSPSMNQLAHLQQNATLNTPDNVKKQETLSSPSGELKSGVNDNEDPVNIQDYGNATDGLETGANEPKQHGQAVEESGGSSTAHENAFEVVHGSKLVAEATTGDSELSQVTQDVHKSVLDAGKDSSTSFVPIISKKPVSASHKSTSTAATSNAGNTAHISKQHRLKMRTFITNKKDVSNSSSADEGMQRSRHSEKAHPKGVDPLKVKSSQTSRISSKHTLSGSKEQRCEPSLKELPAASKSGNTATLSVSCEKIESSQAQSGSTQSKLASSGSCQKNEKLSHPVPQPLSKLLCHSISMHPQASAGGATTLSDEELALLLHQELNSSPRVPRVPRMRQTSGMQTASQSAPSMLSKRSSHSGGKDQVFRRKIKEEVSKGGSRNSQVSNDETRRAARALSPPNRKCRGSAFITDCSSKKGLRNKSPDTAASMKKNLSGDSTEGETGCPFETRGKSALFIRSSPRDWSDDTAPHTLPGLIDEIMSKRKCSTYEELCDAVRPHWHKVRKPNGDRYAYSSHSHAVLDCLRNRSEWAHLIDRGPKTNSSKRRKHDSDTAAESENEEAKNKASRQVEEKTGDSHQEDFPKGKRNMRKRRRLELHGQSVNKAGKRKHAASPGSGILSNDDDKDDDVSTATLSHSSNDLSDGILSEDESQGAEASTSTSSDSSR